MKVKVKRDNGLWITFSPRTEIDVEEAIARATLKAFGVRCYFFQSPGLPKGYGTFLREKGRGCNVVCTGALECS
jgi:hypothetical protein